jgi:hypothetical protein
LMHVRAPSMIAWVRPRSYRQGIATRRYERRPGAFTRPAFNLIA